MTWKQTRKPRRKSEEKLVAFIGLIVLILLLIFGFYLCYSEYANAVKTQQEREQARLIALEHAKTTAALIEKGLERGEIEIPLGFQIDEDGHEFWYAKNNVSSYYESQGLDTFWLSLDYKQDEKEATVLVNSDYPQDVPAQNGLAFSRQYADKVQQIVKGCPANATEYEKALYIHDWIIQNCAYDHENSGKKEKNRFCSTAYACIGKGTAVCSGYSKAFCVLAEKLDLKAEYITGWGITKDAPDPSDDNGHAWNSVMIDGKSLYIDVTWDDPSTPGKQKLTERNHKYFLLDKEEMEKENHIFR